MGAHERGGEPSPPVLPFSASQPMRHRTSQRSRLSSFAVFTLIALIPGAITAQETARRWQGGLAVGAGVPSGRFADRTSTGLTGSGFAEWRPTGGRLAVRAEGTYASLDVRDATLRRFRADEGSAVIAAGTLNLVIGAGGRGRVRPYLLGGIGVYRRSLTLDRVGVAALPVELVDEFGEFVGLAARDVVVESPFRTYHQTRAGLNAGAGVAVPLGRGLQGYVEARFHDVFTERARTGLTPLLVGLRF